MISGSLFVKIPIKSSQIILNINNLNFQLREQKKNCNYKQLGIYVSLIRYI
jgi:hypothetical protein